MQDGQNDLWHDVLRGDEVYIMDMANILQFYVPFRELFGCQILAISLMSYIMVLAKHTPKVAAREEDRPASVVAYRFLLIKLCPFK